MKQWKWKSTIIDFNAISDEKSNYCDYLTKKQEVFHYLGIPDDYIHEWKNGSYSSEYNTALKYAKELGLIEEYIDYDDLLYEKDKEIERLNNTINELEKNINEEINKYKGIAEAQGIFIDKDLYERCDHKIGTLMFILDKLKSLKEGK